MAKENITLRVNGADHTVEADPATPLLYVLRGGLGLTGVKLGCGLEQCGSCAVLVDGVSTLCCNRPVAEFPGKDIITVEGLAKGDALNAIQQAFVEEGAAQCGYCTPGIVIAATSLLKNNSKPTEQDVIDALHPHLCRCGSHPNVMRAVNRVIKNGGLNDAV
jgi:aerobic-type carbon monoxide dehydrogenase small subunit (CoxS/CutS family)